MNIWPWEKKDVHFMRRKAIELLEDETYGVQKEIIESLIATYLPKHHLHLSPKRKVSNGK